MLYVLLFLVVALAIVGGAEFAMLKVYNAEYRAEIAKLTCKNRELETKLRDISKMDRVKGGLE